MKNPTYKYSKSILTKTISELASLSAPHGLVVRYAIKANPHPEIIKMVDEAGLFFDASSSYEAQYLLDRGVDGKRISVSSQQSAHNLDELLEKGVDYTCTSLKQVEDCINSPYRTDKLAVRINPGMGSGHNNRTSTGGVNASFGIWHEYIPEVMELAGKNSLTITKAHFHIGSGADPDVWADVVDTCLDILHRLPDVTTLNIGGGFKVNRYNSEKEADMPAILEMMGKKRRDFNAENNRQLKLEIEPGTYLVAHCGTLVARVDDIVDTGADGFTFLRLNTGMNDFLRSSMYGSRHRIEVINDSSETKEYVVVGHNCESGDILSPQDGDPEGIETRVLKKASIGDEVHIYDTGAYCASMRAKGYNAFPDADEVFVD